MARIFAKATSNQILLPGSPVQNALDGAPSITLAAWVRTTGTLSTGQDDNRIFFGALDGISTGIQLSMRSSRVIRLRTRPEASNSLIAHDSVATVPNDTAWHLIGGVLDYANKTITPYIGGVAGTPLTGIAWAANAFTFGVPTDPEAISGDTNGINSRLWLGGIGWLAFWRGTLAQAAWDAMVAGMPPDEADPGAGATIAAYFPLSESGPIVTETVSGAVFNVSGNPLEWWPDPYLADVDPTLARPLATDTFGGAADTNLSAHASDNGVSWAYHPTSSESGLSLTGSGALKSVHAAAGTNRAYLDAPQTSKQVRISCDVDLVGAAATGRNWSLFARYSDTTDDGVSLRYLGSSGEFRLIRVEGGVTTTLGSFVSPLPSGKTAVDVIIGFRDCIVAVGGKTVAYGRNATNVGLDRFGVVGLSVTHDAAGTSPYEISNLRVVQGPASWDLGYGSGAVAGSTYAGFHLPTILDAGEYVLSFAEARYALPDDDRKDIVCRRALKADLLAGVANPWSAPITVDGTGGSDNQLNHNPTPLLLSNGDIEVYYFHYASKTVFNNSVAGSARIFRRVSTDGGLTWSARVDVTADITPDNPHRISLGPGPAIRLPSGRTLLVFTQAVGSSDRANRQTRVAYRDTDADPWTLSATIDTDLVESSIASLGGQKVILNQRNTADNQSARLLTISEDGGATWGATVAVQPPTQASRDTPTGCHQGTATGWQSGQAIASGPTDTVRKRLGLWWTADDGATWEGQLGNPATPFPGAIIDDGFAGYSNVIPLGADHLAVAWVGGADGTGFEGPNPNGLTPAATLVRWTTSVVPRSYTTLGVPAPIVAGTLSAPTGITASAATLAWTAASGGGGAITSQLQRRTATGPGVWQVVAGATSSPATDSGLSAETAYEWRVSFTDGSETAYSNTVSGTTASNPVDPIAPGGTPTLVSVTGTSATIAWTDPTGGVGPYAQQLQISTDELTWNDVPGATASPATINELTPGQQYFARVRQTDLGA